MLCYVHACGVLGRLFAIEKCTRGGVHFRGLGPGQRSFEVRKNIAVVASPWRHCVRFDRFKMRTTDLTGSRGEPQTSRTDSNVLTTELTGSITYSGYRKVVNLLLSICQFRFKYP